MDYRPDYQISTPGIFITAENVVPHKDGAYFTSFTAEASGYTSSIFASGSARGARQVTMANGTKRLIVGGFTAIKEANGSGGWTDRSSGTYTLATGDRWWFEAYGSEVIACNGVDATEKSTTGAFSALSNAPKAKVMIAQSGHLLAMNYTDGAGANPAGIKWNSLNESTDWTATGSNTAGSVTLRESPGPIVAGAQIHDVVVAWKAKSMYVGRRVGGATVWQFNLLSPFVGCISQECWVATPAGIIFLSDTGAYIFDGSVPRAIDDGIKVTLLNSIFGASTTAFMSHDEQAGNVFFWMRFGQIVCYCYNYISQKWSVAYKQTGSSSGELGHATYLQFVCNVRDANYADAVSLGVSVPASGLRTAHLIIATGNVLVNLSSIVPADAFKSNFVTGLLRAPNADPDQDSYLERISPVWASLLGTVREPSAASATSIPYDRISGGGARTAVPATLNANKHFDLRVTGKAVDAQVFWTAAFGGMAELGEHLTVHGKK